SPSSSRARCCVRVRRPGSRTTRACAACTSASAVADALVLRDVRAGYGATVVLEDVRLSLAERGSLAVLGRNGVGKTTLLATVMGHTSFHSGAIEYQGRPLARLPVYERCRLGIGLVPQAPDSFPPLTV